MLLAALAAGAVALPGCRYMGDDKGLFVDARDDYLDAKPSAPLVIPNDLLDTKIADSWPIPRIVPQPATKVFPNAAPRPEVLVGRDLDAVKIQKLGDRSWMVLSDAPEQVWPHVKQFLADSGVAIGREDPPRGVIESVWIVVADRDYGDVLRTAIRDGGRKHLAADEENAAGTLAAGRHQVRFRVERGIRRGSSEVHLDHLRAAGTSDRSLPAVAEVEAEIIAKLAEYFAHGVAQASVSMVGTTISTVDKAQVVKDASGYPALRLNIGFDRAWATIGQALERAELVVGEADRDNAVYRAVVPTAGPRGWLKRIVPGGEEGRDSAVAIHLADVDGAVVVSVVAVDGSQLSAEFAQEVLVTLREFAA